MKISINMQDQRRARLRRLAIWFFINLTIFISCYLNYFLQLKHRYLYKTLGVGLCLSRAAAMVINFNLILVWIPMCKYTLTRLAIIACQYNHRQKIRLNHLISLNGLTTPNPSQKVADHTRVCSVRTFHPSVTEKSNGRCLSDRPSSLRDKLEMVVHQAYLRLLYSICRLRIKSINSFLIAVDHSTSLHTISATTITLASVIHTVAHLSNVINFSDNYDPLLSNLNMASFKGQNPLQLLVSVPGITGCFMILILILMSLSSISAIRNSSFDLFQIFHRLSILFVIFLILHPSSHVLKEQSNVVRHNPDACYERMENIRVAIIRTLANQTRFASTSSPFGETLESSRKTEEERVQRGLASNELFLMSKLLSNGLSQVSQADEHSTSNNLSSLERDHLGQEIDLSARRLLTKILNQEDEHDIVDRRKEPKEGITDNNFVQRNQISANHSSANLRNSLIGEEALNTKSEPCRDLIPLFVAQSSICWYVLGAGLSCYLMDLILRRLRRNKNPIELLSARFNAEGNIIELTLSNNHKRFAHWLPGQFVYLNCPQIATYEWHPFTISSMDNRTRQFTLHIKTGGDWTRKLRHELECGLKQRQQQHHPSFDGRNSMSLFSNRNTYILKHCCNFHLKGDVRNQSKLENDTDHHPFRAEKLHRPSIKLTDFDCHDHCSGRSGVQCKISSDLVMEDNGRMPQLNDTVNIELDEDYNRLQPICYWHSSLRNQNYSNTLMPIKREMLDMFIDGPFHSPFERLLEQQVSICIANGVGWTAFSSVFQQITNNNHKRTVLSTKDDWWSQWRDYIAGNPKIRSKSPFNLTITSDKCANVVPLSTSTVNSEPKLPACRLHLMIIVTNIEQLRPFYSIAMRYYERLRLDQERGIVDIYNPLREITAYVTRSNKADSEVHEFCEQQKLDLRAGSETSLLVNETFSIIFGKPNFDSYLSGFSSLYQNRRKISIYCCGSFEVKRTVEKICQTLNKSSSMIGGGSKPVYCYHEENF